MKSLALFAHVSLIYSLSNDQQNTIYGFRTRNFNFNIRYQKFSPISISKKLYVWFQSDQELIDVLKLEQGAKIHWLSLIISMTNNCSVY